MTQVPGEEAHYLPADLKKRATGIEGQPVHALHPKADVPVQHLVDVHHARHAISVHREGRLVRPGAHKPRPRTGGRLGGPAPLPLTALA